MGREGRELSVSTASGREGGGFHIFISYSRPAFPTAGLYSHSHQVLFSNLAWSPQFSFTLGDRIQYGYSLNSSLGRAHVGGEEEVRVWSGEGNW